MNLYLKETYVSNSFLLLNNNLKLSNIKEFFSTSNINKNGEKKNRRVVIGCNDGHRVPKKNNLS